MNLLGKLLGLSMAVLLSMQVVAEGQPSAPRIFSTDGQPSGADPQTRARIHTELASLYFQDGNMQVALDELRIATGADRRYAPAYSLAGVVFASLREYEKAEEQFRKALDIAPDDPEINNNYGWFLCHAGKERQSITYFLKALKNPLYPTPDLAYANAGRCALKAGDLEGAETYLQKAIRLSRGTNGNLAVYLANLRYRQTKFEDARRLVTDALKNMGQPTAEALWLALRVERKLGNRAVEGALAAQLRGRYPDSDEYQAFLKGNFE